MDMTTLKFYQSVSLFMVTSMMYFYFLGLYLNSEVTPFKI